MLDHPQRSLNLHFNPRRPYGRRRLPHPHPFPILYISIHAAHMDGDCVAFKSIKYSSTFQSTPPIWTATVLRSSQLNILRHFNPRRPYGRRLFCGVKIRICGVISIHAAHMDGDSTTSVYLLICIVISIHAAHMDGDIERNNSFAMWIYFNPRRPYGRRRANFAWLGALRAFQSTPPIWTAT